MRRLLLLLPLSLAACNSGGTSVDPSLLAAGQCTALSLEDLNEIFREVTGFLGLIGATLPPEVTYNDVTGDFSIAMSLGTIDGNVTSGDDISDGIDAGEAATAIWSLNPAVGTTVTGAGTFNLSRTAAQMFVVTGDGSVADGTCAFNATNVDLDLDLGSMLGPVGSFDFTGLTTGGAIVGTMTFDGSSTASVSATLNAMAVSFTIDLDTFVPHF